ncbi:hypothetical protein G6F42_014631 [Rhizopus arrhizus]|nr:hypothetical protein G6F42_014631 [Rhizopus arrhizus]
MLQEHPTQIQPRSSSTRGETQDDLQQDLNSNTNNHREVDADVSRILIDLANQVTSPKVANEASVLKRRVSSKGDVKASLPIKTDTNLHLHQERSQPDPIMLLAAAAAVIDDEGKYKGRSYERREIRLYGRHGTTKRKSFTYGSNDDSDGRSSSSMLHRRYSERRHRYSRPSVSGHGGVFSSDTWNTPSSNHHIKEDEEMRETKQNPRIKRNAMHAYITYMIYTDMAHEQQRVRPDSNHTPTKHVYNTQQQQQQQTPSRYHHTEDTATTDYGGLAMHHHQQQQQQHDWYQQQSYRLPPSPRQQPSQQQQQQQSQTQPSMRPTSSPPMTAMSNESIIIRPLTDFLFKKDNNTNRSPSNITTAASASTASTIVPPLSQPSSSLQQLPSLVGMAYSTMSTSPTLFDTSSSSAATRLASPQQKIMDTKPRELRSHGNQPQQQQKPSNANNNMNNKKAPWRVPGNFEIPDIIKEAWEKNKNKIHHNMIQQPKKKPAENKPNVQTKRWIPVGKSPSIIPLPPPIVKVKHKLHAEFDAKLRKVLPGSKIMELNPKEQFEGLRQVGSG